MAGLASIAGGEGYNSDEEVYATARAMDGEDSDEQNAADKRKIGPLAPLDHASISYDTFAKDFYDPKPEIALLNPAEVWSRLLPDGQFLQMHSAAGLTAGSGTKEAARPARVRL